MIKKVILLSAVALVATFSGVASSPEAPASLLTERLTNPLGVDNTRPRLDWRNRGEWLTSQTAYEIVAGTDSALVAAGNADLWNTGKV
ncbi:MAG: hypothetical protein K2M68_10280, partial [Muribaculaceae bacterium]|nr:hypothetical protein [Muribaculaceae bacterium]